MEMIGDRSKSALIARMIAAAESRDAAKFAGLTARSTAMPDRSPPTMDEVDRRDEGCRLKRIDADWAGNLAEALWDCPGKNYKPVVERMFLIEQGRVTLMWNSWGGSLL